MEELNGPIIGQACEVVALRKEFKENPTNLEAGLEKIKRTGTGEYMVSLARTFSGIIK